MPFGNIVIGAITYAPRVPGVYSKSTLTYSDPSDEIRISGASPNRDGSVSGSVTRVLQRDVTIGSQTSRKQAVITVSLNVPSTGNFTAAEIDNLCTDIATFFTVDTVSRLLQGEK